MGLLLLAVIGCTPEQEQKVRELIGQHRCAAFNGYLCSAPDDCNVPYLDTIESYCCSIPCQTCNQSCDDGIETTEDYCSKATNYICQHKNICPKSCDDGDICSIDSCSELTNYQCNHERIACCGIDCDDNDVCTKDYCKLDSCLNEQIIPCSNNGICEQGEYFGPKTLCGGDSSSLTRVDDFKSNDCPQTCDDNNPNTADSYDFEAQECKHNQCESIINPETTILSGIEPPTISSIVDNLGNVCDATKNMNCFSNARPTLKIGQRITFTITASDPTNDKILYYCYPSSNQQDFVDAKWQTSNICIWDITVNDYTQYPFYIIFIKDDNEHYFHGGVNADQEQHLAYTVIP